MPRLRLQPRVEVLFLDRHDAAIVTRGRHFGRRLVGDGGERQQTGSPGADQRDHRQATSMSCVGFGLNSSTTLPPSRVTFSKKALTTMMPCEKPNRPFQKPPSRLSRRALYVPGNLVS